MKDRWRVVAAISIGFVLLWFITFVVEWNIRTGWKQHWLDGAIRAWSNFSMLGWFDTTFATGILAVVAASAVFINGYIDRKSRWREVQIVQLAQILDRIGQTQLVLRRVAHELATRHRADRFEALIEEVELLCQQLTSDVTPVAHIVMFSISRVKEIAFREGDQVDVRQRPKEHMQSLLWGAILSIEEPERFFEEATGRYIPHIYSLTESEKERFAAHRLTEYERDRFGVWLKWDG